MRENEFTSEFEFKGPLLKRVLFYAMFNVQMNS